MTISSKFILTSLLIWSLAPQVNPVVLGQIGTCSVGEAKAVLDAGNVRASIYNNGALFWSRKDTEASFYEFPKFEGLNLVFTSTLLIGGRVNGQLRASVSAYGPYDFWPGPIDNNGNPPVDCTIYDKIWEIRSVDFELYESEGIFSKNMRSWPWELGAPVIDGDGIPDNYNLEGGDRPELLGDQTLWWIMNDRGNQHLYSDTEPIGLEVRASAFAFESIQDAGDITFYRYILTNKNTAPFTDAFLGMYVDPALGNLQDNYLGSDSLLHLSYMYNGDPIDEYNYENTPPAFGFTYLITPEAELDEIDNDHDGMIDEEGELAGMHTATFVSDAGISAEPSGPGSMASVRSRNCC